MKFKRNSAFLIALLLTAIFSGFTACDSKSPDSSDNANTQIESNDEIPQNEPSDEIPQNESGDEIPQNEPNDEIPQNEPSNEIPQNEPDVQVSDGIDFSDGAFEKIYGQDLGTWIDNKYGDTYGLMNAILTKYVHHFGRTGYKADNPDDLLFYVMQNRYGGMNVISDDYFKDPGGYEIPADVIIESVNETFKLGDVDMKTSSFYDSESDSFKVDYMGGIGEHDTVLLEKASYSNGILDLTAVVIPSPYEQENGRPAQEKIRMIVRYNPQNDTYAYESVELL